MTFNLFLRYFSEKIGHPSREEPNSYPSYIQTAVLREVHAQAVCSPPSDSGFLIRPPHLFSIPFTTYGPYLYFFPAIDDLQSFPTGNKHYGQSQSVGYSN